MLAAVPFCSNVLPPKKGSTEIQSHQKKKKTVQFFEID